MGADKSLNKDSEAPYCITCKYHSNNLCQWFVVFLRLKAKKIPWNIKLRGCKYYLPQWIEEHKLMRYAIKLLNKVPNE